MWFRRATGGGSRRRGIHRGPGNKVDQRRRCCGRGVRARDGDHCRRWSRRPEQARARRFALLELFALVAQQLLFVGLGLGSV
eukprot:6679865-Lingulodinium_polyedra.AAC.1